MRKTINIDFNNSSSVILGYHPDMLTGSASTGFAWSTHTHGAVPLNVSMDLTNLTGTWASVSNGLTLSLSAESGNVNVVAAGSNISLDIAGATTTVNATGLAPGTHDHGGAPCCNRCNRWYYIF